MEDKNLLDRLASLPKLCELPYTELEWLVRHGKFEVHEEGVVVGPKNIPLKKLWIILTGCIAVRVDRGAGPRLVIEWRSGDVSGMLPYSRMIAPPGNNYVAEKCELLAINKTDYKEMIQLCPNFTAYTVHLMLDRARSFKANDLQEEKMISLGKLAAGLAHELNNPASAILSGAKMLLPELAKSDFASRALGIANLTKNQLNMIEDIRATCLSKDSTKTVSPLDRMDHEDEIRDWLADHNLDSDFARIISETPLSIKDLNELYKSIPGETLTASIQWITTGFTLSILAYDIEKAARRISDLVAAVKRFTYMDNLGKSEFTDLEASLRDTLKVIESKIKMKNASIKLDIDENLPPVQIAGGDLNQIWMNLIDNALDAILENGQIKIRAHRKQNRVIVSILDNGTGIPEDIVSKIFDPFFTTKPPGAGTGLGLDIARRLISCYNGDISFHPQKDWTEFRLSLLIE